MFMEEVHNHEYYVKKDGVYEPKQDGSIRPKTETSFLTPITIKKEKEPDETGKAEKKESKKAKPGVDYPRGSLTTDLEKKPVRSGGNEYMVESGTAEYKGKLPQGGNLEGWYDQFKSDDTIPDTYKTAVVSYVEDHSLEELYGQIANYSGFSKDVDSDGVNDVNLSKLPPGEYKIPFDVVNGVAKIPGPTEPLIPAEHTADANRMVDILRENFPNVPEPIEQLNFEELVGATNANGEVITGLPVITVRDGNGVVHMYTCQRVDGEIGPRSGTSNRLMSLKVPYKLRDTAINANTKDRGPYATFDKHIISYKAGDKPLINGNRFEKHGYEGGGLPQMDGIAAQLLEAGLQLPGTESTR